MSISAVIYQPQNDFEKKFHIPVATEAFFKSCWQPAINALGLQWIDLFSTGVDIEEEDVPSLVEELIQIKEWAERGSMGFKGSFRLHFNVRMQLFL